jgi:hypothetical protein
MELAMLENNITLTGDSGDTTYDLISISGGKSIRSDATQTLATPRSLTLNNSVVGKSASAVDRHLIRLDRVEADPDDSTSVVSGSVYMVLEVPRRVITEAMIKDMVTQLVDFVTMSSGANLEKVLNNEP